MFGIKVSCQLNSLWPIPTAISARVAGQADGEAPLVGRSQNTGTHYTIIPIRPRYVVESGLNFPL